MWKIQTLFSSGFPNRLKECPGRPKSLRMAGTLPDHRTYAYLAVIGSRNHSPYGEEACRKLVSGLAGQPIAIISGLARGIDAIALETAVANGLPAVAVPGSGLSPDVIYPRQNLSLAEDILEAGGCLLSPFPDAFAAKAWAFPERNRIMAGLCQAVLIIEAAERSGTGITARLALDLGRDVLCVPGSIFSPTSRGTNALIQEGAVPITEPEDILRQLF